MSHATPPTPEQWATLLSILKTRFEQHLHRHAGLEWAKVLARLEAHPEKWEALRAMEATGGEPDVTGYDPSTGELHFTDCSPETPAGRRSLCYDPEALHARKANKPPGSAVGMAAAMGIELLNEAQYRALQEIGSFDLKTSSWILTPAPIRALGGALFGDCRYGQVFIYHNGAESYFGARGFRGVLRV